MLIGKVRLWYNRLYIRCQKCVKKRQALHLTQYLHHFCRIEKQVEENVWFCWYCSTRWRQWGGVEEGQRNGQRLTYIHIRGKCKDSDVAICLIEYLHCFEELHSYRENNILNMLIFQTGIVNQSIKFYLYSPYSQTTVRLIGLVWCLQTHLHFPQWKCFVEHVCGFYAKKTPNLCVFFVYFWVHCVKVF